MRQMMERKRNVNNNNNMFKVCYVIFYYIKITYLIIIIYSNII